MLETSNYDEDTQSIDDAIMDFLSKKGSIVDQTEKLALTRISSKINASNEQVQISINGLSAKNLVRKVYPFGKIGFELTPRGKSAIEEIAKAETERVTKQLQEAIHEERKAKLRSSSVNKLKSGAEEWQNYQIPDKNLSSEVTQEATKLLATSKEAKEKQPLCEKDPQNYDQQFLLYKPEAEKLIVQNNQITRAVNNYAKIKDQQLSLAADIEDVIKTITKYESIEEAAGQINQLKTSLEKLKAIHARLQEFDNAQLDKFEELKIQLGDNLRILDNLKKPTHEFAPIKREVSTEKTSLYLDPEGPVKYGRKTTGFPIEEKCRRCGIKRKATSVNIG